MDESSDFNKAWNEYRGTERFQELKKSINQPEPYNENIIWWAFKQGWDAAEISKMFMTQNT